MKKSITIYILLLINILVFGCATNGDEHGTASKFNRLTPGMSQEQVFKLLGFPREKVVVPNLEWRYAFHQYGKGWQFYYLIFDEYTHRLQKWFSSTDEYYEWNSESLGRTHILGEHTPPQVVR